MNKKLKKTTNKLNGIRMLIEKLKTNFNKKKCSRFFKRFWYLFVWSYKFLRKNISCVGWKEFVLSSCGRKDNWSIKCCWTTEIGAYNEWFLNWIISQRSFYSLYSFIKAEIWNKHNFSNQVVLWTWIMTFVFLG